MSRAIEVGVVDLSDARLFLVGGPARKLWMHVLLLAIRDRAETIHFVDGPLVRLTYVIGGKEYELVPPPPPLEGQLVEVVQRRLEADPGFDRRSSRLGRLVRRLFRHEGGPWNVGERGGGGALPWSSNFRLRMGDALADVATTARTEGRGRVLTMSLSNVAIAPGAAAERLGTLAAERRARMASSAGRSPDGPGASG